MKELKRACVHLMMDGYFPSLLLKDLLSYFSKRGVTLCSARNVQAAFASGRFRQRFGDGIDKVK
jgi:hypothetical protein